MKYMGSKRSMLANGLGEILRREAATIKRFADLFVGSGAVAWYVAENTKCKVLAADLQHFAVALADAVIARDETVDAELVWRDWLRKSHAEARRNPLLRKANHFQKGKWESARRRSVEEAREICMASQSPIMQAYGGHYFSPKQALLFDSLRISLPKDGVRNSVAMAALISAASQCAAAPGHTAQPFQPTPNGATFLFEAWRRDVHLHVQAALGRICPRHAQTVGRGKVCDAETLARRLRKGDLAFIDPPYSGVHYSRFYHVLESIARGECGEISGVGRYPAPSERPKSDFSIGSKSKSAMERLFAILAEKGVKAIVTFPEEETSNGLSGTIVEKLAKEYFKCKKTVVNGRFSTLGGNLLNRNARVPAYEVILELTARG
jgi:adenine-specific DNA-methyltransferase